LGIAEESMEVHSLLYNFYKSCNGGFEADVINFEIDIYEITEADIEYIKSLYEKYEEEIEEITSNYSDWGLDDDIYGNYKCLPFVNSEDDVIFTPKEVKKIKRMINKAKKIL
jgi:hypothetical protein